MKSGYAALAVVGVAACVAVYALTTFEQKSLSLYSNTLTGEDREFMRFISKYGKSYGTKEEFQHRSDIFKKIYSQI